MGKKGGVEYTREKIVSGSSARVMGSKAQMEKLVLIIREHVYIIGGYKKKIWT